MVVTPMHNARWGINISSYQQAQHDVIVTDMTVARGYIEDEVNIRTVSRDVLDSWSRGNKVGNIFNGIQKDTFEALTEDEVEILVELWKGCYIDHYFYLLKEKVKRHDETKGVDNATR